MLLSSLVDSSRLFALDQLEHLMAIPILVKEKRKGKKGRTTRITTHTFLMHLLLG